MPARAKEAHKPRCSPLHTTENSHSILLVSGPGLTTPPLHHILDMLLAALLHLLVSPQLLPQLCLSSHVLKYLRASSSETWYTSTFLLLRLILIAPLHNQGTWVLPNDLLHPLLTFFTESILLRHGLCPLFFSWQAYLWFGPFIILYLAYLFLTLRVLEHIFLLFHSSFPILFIHLMPHLF